MIDYLKNKDLGFNKDQTIIVDINSANTRNSFNEINIIVKAAADKPILFLDINFRDRYLRVGV